MVLDDFRNSSIHHRTPSTSESVDRRDGIALPEQHRGSIKGHFQSELKGGIVEGCFQTELEESHAERYFQSELD